MAETFKYDGEDLFVCDHCGEQIYVKIYGRRGIPVTWLTGKGHNCNRPCKPGERHGPNQGRKIILKKRAGNG